MATMTRSAGTVLDRHESVLALLEAFPGERDPKAIIRKLARQKIALAKSYGWKGPAYCPKILASLFDIRCKEVTTDMGCDGRILPYPDGKLWIEYKRGAMPARTRFTIFHELAHTLFPDFCRFLPHHHNSAQIFKDPDKEFETLCDIAASEMLMPLEDVKTDLSKIERLSLRQFQWLSERYEASIDATSHRFTDSVEGIPCATVFLTDQKGARQGTGPLWVKYSCKSVEFNHFVRPGTLVPRDSVAMDCFVNGTKLTEPKLETWLLNGRMITWLAQALKLPDIPQDPFYAKVAIFLLPSNY